MSTLACFFLTILIPLLAVWDSFFTFFISQLCNVSQSVACDNCQHCCGVWPPLPHQQAQWPRHHAETPGAGPTKHPHCAPLKVKTAHSGTTTTVHGDDGKGT